LLQYDEAVEEYKKAFNLEILIKLDGFCN